MDQLRFLQHKTTNMFHSIALLVAMTLLLGITAKLLFGAGAILWVVAMALAAMVLSPKVTPRMVLRMARAMRIGPGSAPDIDQVVASLSKRAHLKAVPDIYLIPTHTLNAFTVGQPGEAAIAVTYGLLQTLTPRQLTGVLAHEISHIHNHDTYVMTTAATVGRLTHSLSFFGQILLLINIPIMLMGQAPMSLLAIILLIIAPNLSALMQLALSRTREYRADMDAARLTGDPEGLATALERLEHVQGGLVERIWMPNRRVPDASLIRSHPKTEDRVARLRALGTKPVSRTDTTSRRARSRDHRILDHWDSWV